MDCGNCEVKNDHSGIKTKLDILCRFREDITKSNGTLDLLWSSIDKKVSRGVAITSIVILIGFVGTLFGLIYHSNIQLLNDVGAVKTEIAVLTEKVNTLYQGRRQKDAKD